MSDSVRPHRRQPTRLPHPWDSSGKNTGVGCHFLLQCMKVKGETEVAQLCLTLSDPMDCSPPGSSVHGILQARVLQWGAIAFSEPHVTSGYHNGQHNCGTLWIVSSLWIYPCLLFLFIFVISNFRLHFRGPKLFSYSFLNSFLYFSLRSLHTG